ncbi:MAG TPA: thioredoxin family protein [Gammaproteobacteria bacterium]|nr:thioredoxin family protein [Gammaproteobacteria bacterium]
MLDEHPVVSREEWIRARKHHLDREKEFTRLRDQLSAERRGLPWVRVEKEYLFDTNEGSQSLAGLFTGKSQLIIYHFMFGPDWEEGCKSCSFWADNFNGIDIHLEHRDITLLAVSRAPLEKLNAYRERMGWNFRWISSLGNDFNRDYHVFFTGDELERNEAYYNYHKTGFPGTEAPGISVFYKDKNGAIYHTYSCYARGLDMLNGAYHYMDLVPKGRDEHNMKYTMEWLRRRDQYDNGG